MSNALGSMLGSIFEIYKDFLPYILVSQIIGILFRVFMTLAVYNDAKSKSIEKKSLFTVLTVFFPVLVPIIYIIVRSSLKTTAPKLCPVCSLTVAPAYKYCPNCNSANLISYEVNNCKKYKKNSKIFVITAIILYIVSSIFSLSYSSKLNSALEKRLEDSIGGYSDFGDGNNFNFDFDDDDDSSDKDDDFENFNNFGN